MQQGHNLIDICYDVKMINSRFLFKDFNITNSKSNLIYIPAKKKVVNFVSGSYGLIKNHQIIEPLVQSIIKEFGKVGIKTFYINIDDRKFYIRVIIEHHQYEVQPGDIITPVFNFNNSYDNSLPPALSIGFIRLNTNCSLWAFDSTLIQLKHRKSNPETWSFSISQSFIQEAVIELSEKLFLIKAFSQLQLTKTDLDAIMKLIKKERIFPKKLFKEVIGILNKELYQRKERLNKWLVYIAFNHLLNHALQKMHPEFRAKADRQVYKAIKSYKN